MMTVKDNLRFKVSTRRSRGKVMYDQYDYYNANQIPLQIRFLSDYDGVMGVPITF
ncbi:MAG: hypothetical protein IPM83_11300 [Ignavibacteria bacterium]|nr:hypothetical protein [Ignavibacteria bacterium]